MKTAESIITILNVNDSAEHRSEVSGVLRAAGWNVLEASTGAESLDMARRLRPELVVLDLELPDTSGLDVCRQIKTDPRTSGILIIQTSPTFIASEGRARGLESGADQTLTEPFEAIELVAMVRGLLRMHDADRRKDEFLAMLAHELRNPLSAILTAHTLLEQVDVPSDGQRLVGTIGRQTRHLARLVDDLLDVSRITRGKIQLRREPIDLTALLQRFLSSDVSLASTTDRSITIDVGSEPIWVEGDEARLEQVFSNLVSNAVKYSKAGGKIALRLRAEKRGPNGNAEFVIRDDGIGIAKENIGSIFDLFFQVDPTLARSQAGLGIGLTMVKRLVEMHGGAIVVRSEGAGQGAEFRIELPMIAPRRATPFADKKKVLSKALSILLVDDNADSCDLLAIAFEQDGHVVKTAHDGEAGLALATGEPFDVAVVDIGLPIVDGYEVARRIRAAKNGAAPVLLALTGYGRSEDKERALAAGFDAHLTKPIDLLDLQRTVAQLIAKRSAAA